MPNKILLQVRNGIRDFIKNLKDFFLKFNPGKKAKILDFSYVFKEIFDIEKIFNYSSSFLDDFKDFRGSKTDFSIPK